MAEQEKTTIRQVSLVIRQPARDHKLEAPGAQLARQVQRDPLARASRRKGDAGSAGEHASTLQRATDGQPARARGSLLRLQREYGNQFVRRVVTLSRQGQGEADVTPEVEESIQAARGGGQALDRGVRAQMEPAMGADFGGVRVHTGGQADALNRSLSARAFTTGQDIFFKQGEYSPGSSGGRELLAHELTHVVQQNAGVSRAQAPDEEPEEETGGKVLAKPIQAKLSVGAADDQYEQEADQMAASVMRQEQQGVRRQVEAEEEEKKAAPMQARLDAGQVRRQVEEEETIEEPVQIKPQEGMVQRNGNQAPGLKEDLPVGWVGDLLEASNAQGTTEKQQKKLRQQALDFLVDKLAEEGYVDPKLLKGEGVHYDPDMARGTEAEAKIPEWNEKRGRAKPAVASFGPEAFAHGVPWLYSKIIHEYQHVRQFQSEQDVRTLNRGGDATLVNRLEVEAYAMECINAEKTGLADKPDLMKENWRRLHGNYWKNLDTRSKRQLNDLYEKAYQAVRKVVPKGKLGHSPAP